MMNTDGIGPEAIRDAALALGLHYVERYRRAGCPLGRTVEGMMLWIRFGCGSRSN